MKTLVLSIALVVCLGLGIPAGAADLTGTWIVPSRALVGAELVFNPRGLQPSRIGYPNADSFTDRLVFTRKKGVLVGVFVSISGDEPLSDLSVEGRTISFMHKRDKFRGELHGNQLRLMVQRGGSQNWDSRWVPYTCRRATAEGMKIIAAGPTYSFKKLPLPVLHDVPTDDLAPTPPMGVGNFPGSTDAEVRKVADEMVADGLRDAGYIYLQIDEGWQGRRDAQGNIHTNANFPDMKALADYVHSKGLKLGLYTSPGPAACWGYAGSYGHEQQDASTYAAWGIDYLKSDWCSAGTIYHTQEEAQALYQKMGEALRSTGHPIVYGLCEYGLFDVPTWGKKVGANLWRTTADMGDRWALVSSRGFDTNGKLNHSGPDGWNDPDNLMIGIGGMTTEEYRTQMALWSMMASPLFIQAFTNDFSKWTPAIKQIVLNKEVIAVDQDRLGIQGRRVSQQGSVEIWTKPLSDGTTAVALFNRGEKEEAVNLHWNELGLKHVRSVRDLWRQTSMGSLTEGYAGTIPAHGSVLVKVAIE